MGMKHREYLSAPPVDENGHNGSSSSGSSKVFGCHVCKTHLSTSEFIESKHFQGQHGKAYLFTEVVNITTGEPSDRAMTTGLHTVRDIYCTKCNEVLGWKYEKAFEKTQEYKEGKFILELALLTEVQ